MTREETGKILRIISTAFPNYRAQYDKASMNDALDLWAMMFGDTPMPVVAEAVKKYIEANNEFAPSIGNIKKIISGMVGNEPLDPGEAWNMVVLAIRNGAYGADEEYEKLPEDVQAAIGGSHYLHELALSQDVNWGVESSNFFRNLNTARERIKNASNISLKVQNLIDQMKEVKPEQLENRQEVARLEQKNYYDELSKRTVDKLLTEERELTEGQRGFADMLRERLGMPKKEDTLSDVYGVDNYDDPIFDNRDEDQNGGIFA